MDEDQEEKLASPSFALFEVQGTNQMIKKQAYNAEMGTSPISNQRELGGTFLGPIIASKVQPSIKVMNPNEMVDHLEDSLNQSQA